MSSSVSHPAVSATPRYLEQASHVTLCRLLHSTTARSLSHSHHRIKVGSNAIGLSEVVLVRDWKEKRGDSIRGHSRHLRQMEQREYSSTALIRQSQGYPWMEAVESHPSGIPTLVEFPHAAAPLLGAPTLQGAKASSCFLSSNAFPRLFLDLYPNLSVIMPLLELDFYSNFVFGLLFWGLNLKEEEAPSTPWSWHSGLMKHIGSAFSTDPQLFDKSFMANTLVFQPSLPSCMCHFVPCTVPFRQLQLLSLS